MESQHHEQRVIELLTGSNVCLVGNSIEIMNYEKGGKKTNKRKKTKSHKTSAMKRKNDKAENKKA